jgi:uncharacterized protein YfiM (DUF2279 family)
MIVMSLAERRNSQTASQRQMNWRGRSGRFYALIFESLDSFDLTDEGLHMLARGGVPMWVGSGRDVIDDAPSRARFRLALAAADRAFRIDAEGDALSRASMVWDLEGAEPVAGLSAA